MAYVCYQVVLRYPDGSGFKSIGELTEDIREAAIARDAASAATDYEALILAFDDYDSSMAWRKSKG